MIFGRGFSPRRVFRFPAILVVVFGILSISTPGRTEDSCSGRIKFFRETKGVIQTPNFPGKFSVPFHCKYVIVNRPDSNVIFTFTQMYLTTGVVLAEYTSISNTSSSQNNTRVWPLVHTRNPDFAPKVARSTKSPFPAIEVDLRTLRNVNVRVMNNLLDVYGFNITYEIVPVGSKERSDAWKKRGSEGGECSGPADCSYNGHCFASSDFRNYTCSCFKGFRGPKCKIGPQCDPYPEEPNASALNPCRNGGVCSYEIGTTLNRCSCLSGFTGAFCERKTEETPPLKDLTGIVCNIGLKQNAKPQQVSTELKEMVEAVSAQMLTLGYFQFRESSASFHLMFNGSYSQNMGNETRNEFRKRDALMPAAVAFKSDEKLCGNFGEQYSQNDSALPQHFSNVLRIEPGRFKTSAKLALDELAQKVKAADTPYNSSFSCIFENPLEASFSIPELKNSQRRNSCRFELSSPERVVKEGENFELTCRAPYSPNRRFVWTKYDGKPIYPQNSVRRMYIKQNEVQMDGCFSSSFEIKKATRHDAGEYICQVEDCLIPRGLEPRKSATVNVEAKPMIIMSPMSASVPKGSNLTIRCYFEDQKYDYSNYTPYTPNFVWTKNGQPLKQTDNEFNEDFFGAAGSMLLLSNIKQSATYSCQANNSVGVGSLEVTVSLLEGAACQEEQLFNVKWNRTAAGAKDVQRCPSNYFGLVSRICNKVTYSYEDGTVEATGKWSEPDFSGCFHTSLSNELKTFSQHAIGYGRYDPNTLLAKTTNMLQLITKDGVTDLHFGGGEMTLLALAAVQEYCWRKETQLLNPYSNRFFDLLSVIMSKPTNIVNPSIYQGINWRTSNKSFYLALQLEYTIPSSSRDIENGILLPKLVLEKLIQSHRPAFHLLIRLFEDQVSLRAARLNASSSETYARGDLNIFMEKMASDKIIYSLETIDASCVQEQNASALLRPMISATVAYPDLDFKRFKHNGTFGLKSKSFRIQPVSFLNTTIHRNDYPFRPPTDHWSFLFVNLPFTTPKYLQSLRTTDVSEHSDSFVIIVRLSVGASRTATSFSFACGKLEGASQEEVIWDMDVCREPIFEAGIAKCVCSSHGTFMLFQYEKVLLTGEMKSSEQWVILFVAVLVAIILMTFTLLALLVTLIKIPTLLTALKIQFDVSALALMIFTERSYKPIDSQVNMYPVSDCLVSFCSSLCTATQLGVAVILFLEMLETARVVTPAPGTRMKAQFIVLPTCWGVSLFTVCVYISVWSVSGSTVNWMASSPLFAASCLTAVLWLTAGSGVLAYLHWMVKQIELQPRKKEEMKRESRSVILLFVLTLFFKIARLLWLSVTRTPVCFIFSSSCLLLGAATFTMYLMQNQDVQTCCSVLLKRISKEDKRTEEDIPDGVIPLSTESDPPQENQESKRTRSQRPNKATLPLLLRAGLGPEVQAAFESSSSSDTEPARASHRKLERQASSSTTYPSARTELSVLSPTENVESAATLFGVNEPLMEEELPKVPHNTPSFIQEPAKSLWVLDWQMATKAWHAVSAFRARSLTAGSERQSADVEMASPESSVEFRSLIAPRQRNESSSSGISCPKQSVSSGSNRAGPSIARGHKRPVFIKWRDPELGPPGRLNNNSSSSSSGEKIIKPYPGKCYLRCSPDRLPPPKKKPARNRVKAIDCGVQTSKELIKPFLAENEVIIEAVVEKTPTPDEYVQMDPAGSLAVQLPLMTVAYAEPECFDEYETKPNGMVLSSV